MSIKALCTEVTHTHKFDKLWMIYKGLNQLHWTNYLARKEALTEIDDSFCFHLPGQQ